MSELKRRIEKAEAITNNAKFAPVVMINLGEPLPDNAGPDTIVITDDIVDTRQTKSEAPGAMPGNQSDKSV